MPPACNSINAKASGLVRTGASVEFTGEDGQTALEDRFWETSDLFLACWPVTVKAWFLASSYGVDFQCFWPRRH